MDNITFEYTYSAQQRKEVEAIRQKYLHKEEDKMEQLRKLHSIPSQKAQAISIAIGVAGALVLGAGMSLFITELGASLGSFSMMIGVIFGLAGMVFVALAYPSYNRTLKKEREKIAPEILRLTDELIQ